jgi:hypothetical protein
VVIFLCFFERGKDAENITEIPVFFRAKWDYSKCQMTQNVKTKGGKI